VVSDDLLTTSDPQEVPMHQTILIVFMTTTLTTAVREFLNFPGDLRLHHWWILVYFVFTKIQFFQGDVRLPPEKTRGLESAGIALWRRAVGFFCGVTSLFVFLLTAFRITIPTWFFGWQAIGLLFDIFWIWNMRAMVDAAKDIARPVVRTVWLKWIWLDAVGLLVSAGLWSLWNSAARKETVLLWTGIGLIALTLDKIFDYWLNREFYFEQL
jgi:hypothetical protein